MRFIDINS